MKSLTDLAEGASKAPLAPHVADSFARFWAAYPHRPRDPRYAAAQVFARLVQGGIDPLVLISAGESYGRAVAAKGTSPEYLPQAVTWLRQRRWEDEELPAGSAAAAPTDPHAGHPLRAALPALEPIKFARWIAPLEMDFSGQELRLVAAGAVERDWVRTHYADQIARHFRRIVTVEVRP